MSVVQITKRKKNKVQSLDVNVADFCKANGFLAVLSQTSIDTVSPSGLGVIHLFDAKTGESDETNVKVLPHVMDMFRTNQLNKSSIYNLVVGSKKYPGEDFPRYYAGFANDFTNTKSVLASAKVLNKAIEHFAGKKPIAGVVAPVANLEDYAALEIVE